MWATYWDALQEVGGRKVLHALVALGVGMGLLFNLRIEFAAINGVDVIYRGPLNMGPWHLAVPTILAQMTSFIGGIWTFIMIIVCDPVFVSTLERGWREITFSKGTPRWHIFFGRYLAAITLFFIPVLMSSMPLAARLWWRADVPTWHVAIAALVQTFSIAALLAVGALTSVVAERAVAASIIASIGMLFLSMLLRNRDLLRDYFTSEFARQILDWLYYVVPKYAELNSLASGFIQSSTIATSWPLWTTGLFTLATLALTMWLLERKSF